MKQRQEQTRYKTKSAQTTNHKTNEQKATKRNKRNLKNAENKKNTNFSKSIKQPEHFEGDPKASASFSCVIQHMT